MIAFTVPTLPVAQPRQRTRVVAAHGRTYAQNYTPSKHPVNQFKAAVQLAASQAYSGPPLSGPVSLDVLFVFPRPRRLVWKTRQMPRLPHASKPDIDNLTKSLIDALSGTLIVDDAMIYNLSAAKVYGTFGEPPHVEIRLLLHEPCTQKEAAEIL